MSRVKGREGDSFVSPVEQTDRITAWCDRENLPLIEVFEEMDVSGGAPLTERPGLSAALNRIETGQADTLVVAFFDRLFRSMTIQLEVLDRINTAGGRVFALDTGELTGSDDGQWIQGNVRGMMSELYRRQIKVRSGEAQARAIARGVATWDVQLPGYAKGPDGILQPNKDAHVIQEAFRQRADGATFKEIREYLARHGIQRSYHGVTSLFNSRVYLGELHFGKLQNLDAHEPIIDRDLWNTVQRTKVSRGRKPKSDRLLARLGVLRCGTCGARMTVGTVRDGSYPFYRCPPTGDCARRQTISARIVETVVTETVKTVIADEQGRYAAETKGQTLQAEANLAQQNLDAAIRAFAGLEGETAAVEKIRELTEIRDRAVAEADRHLSHLPPRVISGLDWDSLTIEAQRALITATVEKVTVSPGKGAERVSVFLFE